MSKPDHVVWVDVLSYLRSRRPDICRQWFDEIEPVGVSGGVYLTRIPHPIRRKYLQRECAEAFNEAVQAITGALITVRFLGPEDEASLPRLTPDEAAPLDRELSGAIAGEDNGHSASAPHAASAANGAVPAPRRTIQHTAPVRHDGL